MAKIKKFKLLQNLHRFRVLVEDTETNSQFFQLREVSDILHSGKNAFLIAGSEFLNPTTEVLVEILDADGDPIFNQPIRNYAEGKTRVVSIEIYEDTPPGPAFLTLLGELRTLPNGDPIPPQWEGMFNVRYQRRFTIDPLRVNSTKIRVFETPEIQVAEVLAPFRKAIAGTATQISGSPLPTASFGNSLIRVINPNNPTPNIYIVNIPSGSPAISKSIEGGSFTASISSSEFTGTYTTSIVSVFNDTSFEVDPGLISSDGKTFLNFASSEYTISFTEETLFSETTLTRSFADIQLVKLKTFSGDVARAKMFVRSVDEDEFQPIADQPLDALVLTSTQSAQFGPATRMGNFNQQGIIDTFWQGGLIASGGNPRYVVDASVALNRNTSQLIDSMFISNQPSLQTGSSIPRYFMGMQNDMEFLATLEYVFSMDALCVKSNDGFDATLEVYLTGSAFPNSNSQLGIKIATITAPVGQIRNLQRDFDINFVPSGSGLGNLNFVITAGDWYVSDVVVQSSFENGFNPDCAEFVVPILGRRFETLEFKAQLFDPNNNVFPVDILSDEVFFNGGNLLLRGTDHRVEGTLTVSPSGSGVTITSTGYIDTDDTPVSGSAVYMGEGKFFHSGTAFLVAEDPDGDPVISLADKLRGYVDPVTEEFILEINGTILIGSGSSFRDIRSLLPSKVSDDFFHRLRGNSLDFWEIQGKKALMAGNIQSDTEVNFAQSEQVARMGRYTRGTVPRTVGPDSPLIVSGLTSSIDPLSADTVVAEISSSGTINVPEGVMVWNEALYGNLTVNMDEVLLAGDDAYELQFELIVDTSWVGFKSGTLPGSVENLNPNGTRVRQTVATTDSVFITATGSFSPDPFISYPIHIPQDRPVGFNTLYVVVELQVQTILT
jgi:hypothetical protein